MLEKMNEGKILDYRKLSVGASVNHVGKLQHFRLSTVQDSGVPFVMFTFKDANNVVVSGVLFDVSLNEASLYLKRLKGRAVNIWGHVQLYRERYSIRIGKLDDITEAEGDYESVFTSEVEDLEGYAEEVKGLLSDVLPNYSVPFLYSVRAFDSLYGGLRGGAIKFYNGILRSASSYMTSPGIETKVFISSLARAVEVYLLKLQLEEDVGFADTLTLFRAINDLKDAGNYDDREFGIIFDVCASVAGLSKPVHPYSFIVKKLIDTTYSLQEVVSFIPTMVVGETQKVGGSQFTKF